LLLCRSCDCCRRHEFRRRRRTKFRQRRGTKSVASKERISKKTSSEETSAEESRKEGCIQEDNAGKKDGKQDDLGTKLKLQIETLEVERLQLVHAGRSDDAEFIAKQIKELEDFAEENRQTLNKLLSDKGQSEVDADDWSIQLSDKDDDDSDMDIDKANFKRKRGGN